MSEEAVKELTGLDPYEDYVKWTQVMPEIMGCDVWWGGAPSAKDLVRFAPGEVTATDEHGRVRSRWTSGSRCGRSR